MHRILTVLLLALCFVLSGVGAEEVPEGIPQLCDAGNWLPPVEDGFILGRKAIPIKFWLQEAPSGTISAQIFTVNLDDAGNVTLGESVHVLGADELGLGLRNKRCKAVRKDLPGVNYTIILKGSKISLEEGRTYALAIIADGKVLAIGEGNPAVLTFTAGDTAVPAQDKAMLRQCRIPKQKYAKFLRRYPRNGF